MRKLVSATHTIIPDSEGAIDGHLHEIEPTDFICEVLAHRIAMQDPCRICVAMHAWFSYASNQMAQELTTPLIIRCVRMEHMK